MAELIGLIGFDFIRGTPEGDLIFGDPFNVTPLVPDVGFDGIGGSDVLLGRGGNDFIYGDAFQIGEGGQGGDDLIRGGSGDDVLSGDALRFNSAVGLGKGGDDTLFGGAGNDSISGDTRSGPFRESEAGDDVIYGGQGDDFLQGDGGAAIDSFLGDDLIRGGSGNDKIYGDTRDSLAGGNEAGDDRLFGGSGDDEIFGDWGARNSSSSGGDDFINGGTGSDDLWGDGPGPILGNGTTGADIFFFGEGSGLDTIHDFEDGQDGGPDHDLIDFSGYTKPGLVPFFFGIFLVPGPFEVPLEFDDLVIANLGTDSIIDIGASAGGTAGVDVVTVLNTTDLGEDDFIFA